MNGKNKVVLNVLSRIKSYREFKRNPQGFLIAHEYVLENKKDKIKGIKRYFANKRLSSLFFFIPIKLINYLLEKLDY